MTEIERNMDVERVKNLVGSFGWAMTKQESTNDRVVITLEKGFEPLEVETDKGAS